MKRTILAFVLGLFALGISNAQVTIEIHPDDLNFNLSGDLTDDYTELVAHATITNTSNQNIKVKWQLDLSGTECPSTWQYAICDTNACYSFGVFSNINSPNPGPNAPVNLKPNDVSRIDIHIRPTGTEGCCSPVVKFTEVTGGAIDLGSATFEVCITPLSSVKDQSPYLNIQAFPNPTTGHFSLTDNPFVKQIAVYNLFGQKVCHYQHTNGATHDFNNAPAGLYLVNLLDENGEMLKTIRMTKEGNR
ncbi:MAG: T9SS type A sorting domain-containing protein [Saprospiraceae bacterium]|nr:T9SS type A sorting domain-containing protein [Saprospiraceae bacterium]